MLHTNAARVRAGLLLTGFVLSAAGRFVVQVEAVASQEKTPPTPGEQYQALLKEYDEALTAYVQALENAQSEADRWKVVKEQNLKRRFAPRFLAFADQYPDDPVAVDALAWILQPRKGGEAPKEISANAVGVLVRKHLESEKLGPLCQALDFGVDQSTDELLKLILEKSPHKTVKGEACLALGLRFFSRTVDDSLTKEERAKLETAYLAAYEAFATKYAPDMEVDRLKEICQGTTSEALLAVIAEKDKRREVLGNALILMAYWKKQRAESMRESQPEETKRLLAECEKSFEEAADKYADVKTPYDETVGAKAKAELFDLHHLLVGMMAPEVEGVDQDGKSIKLSDFTGKVVLLDFWSQH